MKPIDQNLWWEKNLNDVYKWNEFASWLSLSDRSSRVFLYNFCEEEKINISSVLEIGPGSFIDYDTYFNKQKTIDYSCVDITTNIVEKAIQKGITSKLGTIKNIPFKDKFFDLVYTRHVLEHIDYYKEAIFELIRVSDKYIICIFFHLNETSDDDSIIIEEQTKLYHNRYSKNKINIFLKSLQVDYTWHKSKKDHILVIKKPYDILY